jgi:flagellar basal-body rod protein FlgB
VFNDRQIDLLSRLMDAQMLRSQVHRANLANTNTPGYRAQAVAFEDAFRAALDDGGADAAMGVRPEIIEPRSTMLKVDGNDVSTDRENVQLAQAQVLYNAFATLAAGKMKLLETAATPAPGG